MAKFHAGASYPAKTITASTYRGGGTISPTGAVSVPYEADQTFTITKNYGYAADVVVDGVSQGDISSYTFTAVTAERTRSRPTTPRLPPARFRAMWRPRPAAAPRSR